jgi:hypothetical protein
MNGVLASMAQMTPQQLQQTAAMHSDNAMIVSTAKFYSDQQKQMQQAQMAKMQPQAQPPVNQQAIAAMAPSPQLPPAQQAPLLQGQQAQMATNRLPEESGIATLPAPNMRHMAGGGIVAFDDGGAVDQDPSAPQPDPTAGGIQGAGGGDAFNFANQQPTHGLGFSGGGIAHFADKGAVKEKGRDSWDDAIDYVINREGGIDETDKVGGLTKYGISQKQYPNLDIDNLTKDQAHDIYRKDYVPYVAKDPYAAKDPKYATALLDTAINQGPTKARLFSAQAKGDVGALLDARQQHYDDLVATPAGQVKYGDKSAGWKNRLAQLATDLAPGTDAQAAEQAGPPSSAQPAPTPKAATGWDAIKGTGKGIASLFDTAYNAIPGMAAQGAYNVQRFADSPENAAKTRDYITRNFSNPLGNAFGITQDPAYQNEASRRASAFVAENQGKGANWISQQTGMPVSDVESMLQSLSLAVPTAIGRAPKLSALKAGTPDAGLVALAAAKEANAAKSANAARGATLQDDAAMSGAMPEEMATVPEPTLAQRSAGQDAAAATQARAAADYSGQRATGRDTGASNAAAAAATANQARKAATTGIAALANPGGTADPSQQPAAAGQTGGNGMPPYHDSVYDAPKVDPATAQKAAEVGAQSPQAQAAEAKGFSLSNQDLVMMGLGIMGGKSRYALENIGSGGLQGLAASRAQTGAEAKAAYEKSMSNKAEAQASMYNMHALHPELFLGSYYANDAKKGAQYEQTVLREMAQWDKDNAIPGGMSSQLDPNFQARRMQAEMAVRQKLAPNFGITNQPDTGTVAAAPASTPRPGFGQATAVP